MQGVGGAMILPSTQSILNTNFRGRDRAIAFGIWGATIGGMAAVGPLIGGWLTTYLTWRWAFFINIPIAAIAFFGTLRYIKESKDENAKAGLDPAGFLLITLGLGAFVFGLIEGRTYGWWAPTKPFTLFGWTWPFENISIIPVAIGFGLVALVLFFVVEGRRSRAGKFFLFDVELWRYKAFRYGNLAGSIVSLGEFGLLFALPLFLQAVVGYSAFETGVVFLALAMGAFVAAPLAARASHRWGPRRVVTLGMSLEAIGIIATTLLISVDVTGLQLAIPLFVYGIGVGFATAQLTSIVLSDIPAERSGLASGANSTVRQVGSALGIAILGTVLFVSLGNGVHGTCPMSPGCHRRRWTGSRRRWRHRPARRWWCSRRTRSTTPSCPASRPPSWTRRGSPASWRPASCCSASCSACCCRRRRCTRGRTTSRCPGTRLAGRTRRSPCPRSDRTGPGTALVPRTPGPTGD